MATEVRFSVRANWTDKEVAHRLAQIIDGANWSMSRVCTTSGEPPRYSLRHRGNAPIDGLGPFLEWLFDIGR